MSITVTEPPSGSTEGYARILRKVSSRSNIDGCALAIVQAIAGDLSLPDATKVERILRVARAAEQVDSEPADTGLSYSRADDEPDDPTPISPARVPLHTGAMTDHGLVEITSAA
jgi:hypothetical protein